MPHLQDDAPPGRGPGGIFEWAELTARELEAIDRTRAVVLVTCSPLEVHGPHLPLGTDFLEAEAIGRAAALRLVARRPGLVVLHLPPLYVAADVVPHPGSVRFRPSTITRVLMDLGRSLARQGFRHLWVTSFHGGPRHWVPIEVAAHRVNRRHGVAMVSLFSLLVNRLTGGNSDLADLLAEVVGLPPEALRGDTHAGAVETAMMLHLLGDRVDAGFRDLPRRTVSGRLEARGLRPLSDHGHPGLPALLRGFYYKLKYFEEEIYAGAPALATPEMGATLLAHLADLAVPALEELLDGKLDPAACRSPLWPLRWLFLNETLSWVVERALGYRDRVF